MATLHMVAQQDGNKTDYAELMGAVSPRQTVIQVALAAALGVGTFIAFCVGCFVVSAHFTADPDRC